jgi:membrane protein
VSTALAAVTKYFGEMAQLQAALGAVLGSVVSIGIAAVLFALIFKVLPDAKILWKDVWLGALVTAILFEIGKFGLGFYLGRESTASSFGAAGSVVLLLLWVYYASCILLFGAEFTQVYAKASGRAIKPAAGASAVTEAARAEQGIPHERLHREPPREVIPHERTSPEPPRELRPAVPAKPELGKSFVLATAAVVLVGAILRRR